MDTTPMKNILINSPGDKINKLLFTIALKYAERGQKVFYITTKPLDQLPAFMSEISTTVQKTILQNILFRYHETYDTLIETLIELHKWTFVPELIIIESLQLYFYDANNLITYKKFIEKHSLTIATLQNAVQELAQRPNGRCFSVMTLDNTEDKFIEYYQEFLQVIIDLYYVQAGSFIDGVSEDFVDAVCGYIDGGR